MTRKRLRTFLGLIVLVAVIAATRLVARGMVYHPWPDRGTPCPPGVEDVYFASEDGTKLHGWLLRTPGATRAVLMAHGNAGNLEERGTELFHVARVTSASVFMFDYRGYGRSQGSPFEEGVCADARAALAALGDTTKLPRSRTVLLGHSLGGAVVIDLAARTPDAAGLVVLSSFTSIGDMARAMTGMPLGFMVPETWASSDKIAKIAIPKLIVHGDADTLIPFQLGCELFARAPDPKHFVRLQGVGHNDPLDHSLGPIGDFVKACAP